MDKNQRKKIKGKIKELQEMCKAYRKSIRVAEKEISKLQKKSKHKMRKGGGRVKGNSFENEIAKQVAAAFAEYGITREDCYRTPASGGHKYAKKEDPGDLVISKKLRVLFPFHVECKSYKKVDLYPFFDGQKNWGKSWCMAAWIDQAVSANQNDDLTPVVVFKQNNSEVLAVLPALYPLMVTLMPRLTFKYEGEEWFVVKFSKLLSGLVKAAKNRDTGD